jgi:tetratricopeptide (TPR) repeat protein
MRTLALIVTCLRLPMGWALQRELFGWALELAEDPRLVGDPQHAEVLAAAGFASWRQGDLPGAARYADEGLAAALTAEQRAGCTDIVASVALLEGRPAEAADLWLNAGVERTWETLASAAIALGYAGRPEEAIRLARQALTDARTAGAPIPIAFCCYTLGELLMGTDEEAAEALLREGVELDPPSLGGFTGGLAQLTLVTLWQRRGDRSAALSGYRDLVDRWWRSGSWTQEWTTLRNLADLLASTSERPTALLLLTAAAQTTSAPALSAAEGARLDRLRSDLEAELGSRVVDEPAAVVHDALAAIDRLLET